MLESNELSSRYDVLIVGSGAAGLYAALRLPRELKIGLVTKENLKTGASDWAQGGIAAASDPTDSPELHLEDTLKAGAGLCDRPAVKFLVENAPAAIRSLVELGVNFDRHNGEPALTLEAAHSRPRVLHAADRTGRAIVTTLMEKVRERENIQIIPMAIALKLWLDKDTGNCSGVALLHLNRVHWIGAGAVILATGGGGQIYSQTTNPAVSTGDGIALAGRAGALIRDLEFFQFHPTALTVEGAPRFLISEAVRGEGAHLIDKSGERFAYRYDPAGELAPRDVVSRAIFTHLQNHPEYGDRVYLDLKPIPPEKIERRFPNIVRVCQKWGIDVYKEPIPVSPAAHYWMGGIYTDLNARTSIGGLYAIGETASTGVQGANRLASNSLLECIVFAERLREITPPTRQTSFRGENLTIAGDWSAEMSIVSTIREKLPVLMWESAGICRREDRLQKALERVEIWREEMDNLSIALFISDLTPTAEYSFTSPFAGTYLKSALETLNLLDLSRSILKSALFRTESRGGHYREDYPLAVATWRVHTTILGESLQKTPVQD